MARAKKAAEPAADVIDITKGVVRIGARTYTVGLAIANGLLVRGEAPGTGMLTAKATEMLDSQGAAALRREENARAWRRKQGIPEEPATTADGRLIQTRQPKPLKPANVTPDGEPVTDAETLAQIEARTAAIEKAHLAEVEASGG